MSYYATKKAGQAIKFGGRQVVDFAGTTQGPIEAMGGTAIAMAGIAALPLALGADLVARPLVDKAASMMGNLPKGQALKNIPRVTLGAGKTMARKAYTASEMFAAPISKSIHSAQAALLKQWEPRWGARKVLGGSLAGGALFGAAMSSFKFNREVSAEAMANAQEGSAYEAGPGAFGAGSGKSMPYSSGRMTLGMHRRRHG